MLYIIFFFHHLSLVLLKATT